MIELYFVTKESILGNLTGVGESTPSFLSTLKPIKDDSIQDEELNKKIGRGKYGIEKKYFIPFMLMGAWCNTCGETTSFARWKIGTMYPDKGVQECMNCKTVKYI